MDPRTGARLAALRPSSPQPVLARPGSQQQQQQQQPPPSPPPQTPPNSARNPPRHAHTVAQHQPLHAHTPPTAALHQLPLTDSPVAQPSRCAHATTEKRRRPRRFEPWHVDDGSHPTPSGLDHSQSLTPSPLVRATVYLIRTYARANSAFGYSANFNPRRVLTKPEEAAGNAGYDNDNNDYILHVNDLLDSPDGDTFQVIDLLGTGTFGQVVKCKHLTTGDVVAIKVIKNSPAYFRQAWMEVYILDTIHRRSRSDQVRNIVSLRGHFVFRNHLCLVFEKLSINLFELIKQNKYRGIGLDLLRHFLVQLLSGLTALANCRVIHCDLKPENILLESLSSTNIKIIDFGSACQQSNVVYSYVQSRFYRSPEVLLGAPYDSKIDMWSLGCVAGELFLGLPLFPGQSEQNMVARITEMIGMPSASMLARSKHCFKYFNEDSPRASNPFSIKSDQQFSVEQGVPVPPWKKYFKQKELRHILLGPPYSSQRPSDQEIQMRNSFIDLVEGLLQQDPTDRWSPEEASLHPFLHQQGLPAGSKWVPPSRVQAPVMFHRVSSTHSYGSLNDQNSGPLQARQESPSGTIGSFDRQQEQSSSLPSSESSLSQSAPGFNRMTQQLNVDTAVRLHPLIREKFADDSRKPRDKPRFGGYAGPSPPDAPLGEPVAENEEEIFQFETDTSPSSATRLGEAASRSPLPARLA